MTAGSAIVKRDTETIANVIPNLLPNRRLLGAITVPRSSALVRLLPLRFVEKNEGSENVSTWRNSPPVGRYRDAVPTEGPTAINSGSPASEHWSHNLTSVEVGACSFFCARYTPIRWSISLRRSASAGMEFFGCRPVIQMSTVGSPDSERRDSSRPNRKPSASGLCRGNDFRVVQHLAESLAATSRSRWIVNRREPSSHAQIVSPTPGLMTGVIMLERRWRERQCFKPLPVADPELVFFPIARSSPRR